MIDLAQLAISIDTQRSDGAVLISPHLESPDPLTLQYRMTVRQISNGGTSSINQLGDLQSGAASSTVRLSLPPGATCEVQLQVFQDDKLLKQIDRSCS